MKRLVLIFAILLSSQVSEAQFVIRKQFKEVKAADSLDISYYSRRNGWLAAGEVFGLNMGVWGFNRFIVNEDFAHISFKTMGDNLKKGFVWDNDQIGTNMFLHPYHGNLYYNAARSQGFNYWESGAYAFGGSLMWELFMENEYPSINDIIATPIGGSAIGEVFHRASDLVLDDRRRGNRRFRHELAGFLIAPTRGITRLINGDAWKVRQTTGRQFGTPLVSIDVSSGLRVLEVRDDFFDKGAGFATNISVEYGDRFDNENVEPYDYFSFRGNINIQASQPILGQVNVIGRLWAIELIDNSKDFFGLGAYQHFDYYDSDTISSVSNEIPYKFGTPASFGLGIVHKSKRFEDWHFDSYAHANVLLLGASLSDHYLVDKRNYNLGSGFGWKAGVNIAYKDKIGASWLYEGYRLFTWKGYEEGLDLSTVDYKEMNTQGDKSVASFNTSSVKIDVKLKDKVYLTGIGTWYRRSTHYTYFDNVRSITAEGRLMLTYKF